MKSLLAAMVVGVAVAHMTLDVGAQAMAARGWALDRFEPAPAGEGLFFAEHPAYARRWGLAAGLTLEHATSPLRVFNQYADGRTESSRVIASMTVAWVAASASFGSRWGVEFALPVSIVQSGSEALLGTIVVGPSDRPLVGDTRLGARLRVVGRAASDRLSVHLGGRVWLPTGSRSGNTSDGALRAEPRIILAGSYGALRWSLSSGLMFRKSLTAHNLVLGTEVRFTGALAVDLLRGRLRVGPEMYLLSPLGSAPSSGSSAFFGAGQWGGELLGTAHLVVSPGLVVGGAIGFGLQQAGGTPGARVAVSLTWRGPPGEVTTTALGVE